MAQGIAYIWALQLSLADIPQMLLKGYKLESRMCWPFIVHVKVISSIPGPYNSLAEDLMMAYGLQLLELESGLNI